MNVVDCYLRSSYQGIVWSEHNHDYVPVLESTGVIPMAHYRRLFHAENSILPHGYVIPTTNVTMQCRVVLDRIPLVVTWRPPMRPTFVLDLG